jgi:hypothetical protein
VPLLLEVRSFYDSGDESQLEPMNKFHIVLPMHFKMNLSGSFGSIIIPFTYSNISFEAQSSRYGKVLCTDTLGIDSQY